MKRRMCMVLCLVLICLMPTVQAQENAQGWVFRNGVTWNSTIGDVMTCESAEVKTDGVEGISALIYEDASVSKYSGDLAYMFEGDVLFAAGYTVYSAAEEDVEYLKGAMISKYGPAFCSDGEYFHMLERTFEGKAGLEAGKGNVATTEDVQGIWHLEDGTLIFLASLPIFDGYTVTVMYLNGAYLSEAWLSYNTDGL